MSNGRIRTHEEELDRRWNQLRAEWSNAKKAGTAFDGAARAHALRLDWIRTIKAVREFTLMSIGEAERYVLEEKGWNIAVSNRIRRDQKCRKLALSHLRHVEPHQDALVETCGDDLRLTVKPKR